MHEERREERKENEDNEARGKCNDRHSVRSEAADGGGSEPSRTGLLSEKASTHTARSLHRDTFTLTNTHFLFF